VTVALGAKPMIVLAAASGIALHTYLGPMIKRIAEVQTATGSHDYCRFLFRSAA
jgi:hypothetical protein